jgi:hypothetical protein
MMAAGRIFAASLLAMSLASCAICPPKDEAMYTLASELTKLCKAVEATVRYEDIPEDIADQELLILATVHDPSLLTPFADYTLKTIRGNRHAALLLCSKDGATSLLEDACCTPPLETHHWMKRPRMPCSFILDLNDLCK